MGFGLTPGADTDNYGPVAVASDVELFTCDVRDQDALEKAFNGAEVVMHLAAINGTENFYKQPELVLDVGLRGALAVVNAGRAVGVPDLVDPVQFGQTLFLARRRSSEGETDGLDGAAQPGELRRDLPTGERLEEVFTAAARWRERLAK